MGFTLHRGFESRPLRFLGASAGPPRPRPLGGVSARCRPRSSRAKRVSTVACHGGPPARHTAITAPTMEYPSEKNLGEMRAEIATAIVRLQNEYYGKGPTRAKTYIQDDVVVVVLEETFTRAEQTLIERGESESIQQIRRRFQMTMADEFKSIVEQATGRVVRAFVSDTSVEADVSIEFFLLGETRTDMLGFEPEA